MGSTGVNGAAVAGASGARPAAPALRAAAALAIVAGLALIGRALGHEAFRTNDGFLDPAFGLPLAGGLALLVVGVTVTGQWRRAGLWLALALAGQASLLQLVDAGPFVRYQHLPPPAGILAGAPRAALLILAAQVLAVAIAVPRVWPSVAGWVRDNFGPYRFAAAALLFALTAATLSREVPVYATELALAALMQAVSFATILLAARAVPADGYRKLLRGIEALLGGSADGTRGVAAEPGGPDRFAFGAMLWVMVVAALLSITVYERHPHIPDEVSYLLQARYFAHGLLAMPAPPVPEAFNLDLMTYEPDRWYSPFPLGWPAMLAVGQLLGAPWLLNPVLGGVCVLLAYVLLRELYPRRTARLAVVFLCASPWFVFMAMSFMAHTFTLACALAAAVAVARLRSTAQLRWAVAGGIAIGVVSLIRPLDGMVVAGLLGLWALPARSRLFRFAPVAVLALTSAAIGALALPYNKALTGDAGRHPVMDYFDRYYGPGVNDLGFGANRGVGWTGLDPFPGHSWIDVLVNANMNTFSINVELLGWGTGSLIAIALLLRRGAVRRSDWLLLAAVLAVLAAQSLYWFSGGPDFGARYWFLMIVPCAALAARGIEALGEGLGAPGEDRRAAAPAAALLLCALALATYFPWRATDKYHNYRGMRPDIRELAAEHDFGRSLVLVRGKRHPDYASAAVYNPLDLQADAPIYAWDRGDDVRVRVLAAYPDRRVWIVDGPTVSASGRYEVVAGPLDPDDPMLLPALADAGAHDVATQP